MVVVVVVVRRRSGSETDEVGGGARRANVERAAQLSSRASEVCWVYVCMWWWAARWCSNAVLWLSEVGAAGVVMLWSTEGALDWATQLERRLW